MTSLETADGIIRVLGAAAQTSVADQGTNDDVKNLELYRKSLPISAVPDGFILSGIAIAAANQFHTAAPNPNANTMTLAEMETALETATLDKALADPIIKARNAGNGFSSVDDLATKAGLVSPDKVKLAQALKFSYGS
jgi:DNA uptake protein ComE-like DNA-binding protein